MKKTLIALAVLGTASSFALAADVSLYGRIDTGMVYQHTDFDVAGVANVDKLAMESGFTTGSRWGIKGSEDLGNGMKVGFTLESGFSSDTGKSAQGGRLFGREAGFNLSGDFGTVYVGRYGTIVSDSGSLSLLGDASVFGNAYGLASMKGSTGATMDRYDNVIGYVTPSYNGFDFRVMYSTKTDGGADGKENGGETTRYAAAGIKYAADRLTAVLTADLTMYGNTDYGDISNGYNIVAGGNYKFDAATVYVKANYFDNMVGINDTFELGFDEIAAKGYGVEIGTKVPAFGGNILAAVGYRHAENVFADGEEAKFITANVGYTYAFSKRTNLYSVVGYAQEKCETASVDITPSAYQVGIGLVHKF